ncbi:ATP-binding protein [Massilia sp. METH4]|uniref:ATP-binding protein n=1 Tax=Massilia sp. METH4 TaxID=3123041 RepID=UPI0030D58AF4
MLRGRRGASAIRAGDEWARTGDQSFRASHGRHVLRARRCIGAHVRAPAPAPYTQAGITPERGEGGLGLGLWLARRLADLHGGVLTAASPGPGKGSTFVLALPLFDPVAGCPEEAP